MTFREIMITAIIGGVFIILGIIGFVFGRRESQKYYAQESMKVDVREFLYHFPWRPEPDALRVGGKIAIAVGIVSLLVALGFYLWWFKPDPISFLNIWK
jgi:hypothetical protein